MAYILFVFLCLLGHSVVFFPSACVPFHTSQFRFSILILVSKMASTPKDAQTMTAILKDMGVTDYEPRVISQLLEFSYRYTSDVLSDARAFSEHAGKRAIDGDDVRLAIDSMLDSTFTQPPPRQLLQELAKEKNSIPLPPIKQPFGARLPPERFCFMQPNYKWKDADQIRIETERLRQQRYLEEQQSKRGAVGGGQGSSRSGGHNVVFKLDNNADATDSKAGIKRSAESAQLDEDYDQE